MKACIIGGLQRREKEYMESCKELGIKAKIFNEMSNSFENSIKSTDFVVFITTLVSHNMANKAKNLCRRHDIPFICTDKSSPDAVTCFMKDSLNCAGDCKSCLFGGKMKLSN